MKKHLIWIAAGLLAAPAIAQAPRGVTQVNAGLNEVNGLAVGSEGDVTAVAWQDDIDDNIYLSVSDGQGVKWSPAMRVDSDVTGASKFAYHNTVVVLNGKVYVAWEDGRFGSGTPSDVIMNVYDVGSGTFAGEVVIPKNQPAGTGVINDVNIAVTTDGVNTYVFVAQSVDNGGPEELVLAYSSDGGATFATALVGVGAGGADLDAMNMCAVGSTVHLAWEDDRNGQDDIWYQRSTDGGLTFLPADVQLDASGPAAGDGDFGVKIACEGSIVAVAWDEEVTSATIEEMRVNVSTDGGTTFNGDTLVGGYIAGTDDVDDPQVTVSGGNVIVAWEDDRNGTDNAFAATSTDGGLTWGADALIATTSSAFPNLTATDSGAVINFSGPSGFPDDPQCAVSRDGGLTWLPAITVSPASAAGQDSDWVYSAFNSLYNNVIVVWENEDVVSSGIDNGYVGGFRIPTLVANGFTGGPSTVNFDLSLFDGTDGFALVVASGAPGSFPLLAFGDSRDLGLTFDALFNLSISSPLFFTTIDASGNGSTPSFPVNLIGVTLYAAAVSFDLSLAPGEITDAVMITVP
jgi:hypothetical protein